MVRDSYVHNGKPKVMDDDVEFDQCRWQNTYLLRLCYPLHYQVVSISKCPPLSGSRSMDLES